MTEEQQKEELSRAYVLAVAAKAGFSCTTPRVDDDSVDLTVMARGALCRDAVDLAEESSSRGDVHVVADGGRAFPVPAPADANRDIMGYARVPPQYSGGGNDNHPEVLDLEAFADRRVP